jgi:hypothetical protein
MRISRASVVSLVPIALLAVAAARPQPAQPTPASSPVRWYKGNTHTHTVNSDGDSTPDEVVRWYRDHRYHFLVLTDHNYLTNVDGLNAVHGAAEKFVVIPGEEVTSTASTKAVHVNGLNVDSLVKQSTAASVVTAAQENVDGIRRANGVPHINHPNFTWAMTPDDLRQIQRTKLFEIYNGHPQVNNDGGGGAPSLDEMWDRILSSGRLLFGVAVDDAHHFKRPGDPTASGPGRGWIFVRAARLEARAIVEAIERGDFYASTGVELASYEATSTGVTLKVNATAYSRYRVQFIGSGGKVLAEVADPAATYTFKGHEGYVRAKIWESNGYLAWTQPVPVGPAGPKLSE